MRRGEATCFLSTHPQPAETGSFSRVRYVEPRRFTTRGIKRVTFVNATEIVRRLCPARTKLAGFFNSLSDSPGARALDQIRLLLFELLHHEADGFFRTVYGSDEPPAEFLEKFLLGRRGAD